MNVSATPLPCSECAAAPAATILAKFLDAMVSAVAPQSPFLVSSPSIPLLGRGSLHGPWAQFLQQVPCMPILHGLMVWARSKMVSISNSLDLSIIFAVAGSMVRSSGFTIFFTLSFFTLSVAATAFSFTSSGSIFPRDSSAQPLASWSPPLLHEPFSRPQASLSLEPV